MFVSKELYIPPLLSPNHGAGGAELATNKNEGIACIEELVTANIMRKNKERFTMTSRGENGIDF